MVTNCAAASLFSWTRIFRGMTITPMYAYLVRCTPREIGHGRLAWTSSCLGFGVFVMRLRPCRTLAFLRPFAAARTNMVIIFGGTVYEDETTRRVPALALTLSGPGEVVWVALKILAGA